jgi:hypothetical protein
MSVTDLNRESAPFAPLPRRRPASTNGDNPASPGLPRRVSGTPEPVPPGSLPRRAPGGRSRRTGRHRSLHRISVASGAPALVLAVPGLSQETSRLAGRIAESASESCSGVDIKIGYLTGSSDHLVHVLAASRPGSGRADGAWPRRGRRGRRERRERNTPDPDRPQLEPRAVVVPLLAGPHPALDAAIASAVRSAPPPVMLATALGPHPLLAGALHDRLSEAGLARASRARGLNIAAGATGIIVIADRGSQALADAGVTAVLLAARLAVPVRPASLGDPASIDAAVLALHDAGAVHLAIAPCVIGPETNAAELATLSADLGVPSSSPLGDHPAIAQLIAVRYGEALARISVASG